MESDIVERLRAVLHNDRSVELTNREAADKIERLRAELAAAQKQRDEARRDACAFQAILKFSLQHPKGIISTEATLRLAKEIAAERGWKCYEQEGGGA